MRAERDGGHGARGKTEAHRMASRDGSVRVGVLHSLVRVEEKLLFAELEKRGVAYTRVDDREVVFPFGRPDTWPFDVVLERCINHTRALHALRLLNSWGVATVNTYSVAEVCGNKLNTTAALAEAGCPQPRAIVAFTPASALAAIEELGYPVVM
jgi:[lysine-biosynthesis-protein LysW]--L-2-aminoadipate ligase